MVKGRIPLAALQAAGVFLVLVPVRAHAADSAHSVNPGFLLSVGNGEQAVGLGAEISGMYYPWSDLELGYGGFLQVQSYAGDYSRVALGAQLGSILGGEIGLAQVSESPLHSRTYGLHLGLFASLAIVGTGVRVTVPVGDHEKAHGTEASWVLTLKWPFFSGNLFPAHGRPLRAAEGIVVAPVACSSNWTARAAEPLVAHLAAGERDELAQLWAQAALVEHASVASFARLVLDLMALGAPPSLLAACQQAALDEIEHARICFSFASAFSGRSLGPGKLDVSRALPAPDAASVARLCWLDGCVNEAFGAMLARRGAGLAADPVVERALSQIAEDEGRHAALAWDVVEWCLESEPEAVRDALSGLLAEPRLPRPAPLRDADDLPVEPSASHGFLPLHERAVLLSRSERLARARLARLLARHAAVAGAESDCAPAQGVTRKPAPARLCRTA